MIRGLISETLFEGSWPAGFAEGSGRGETVIQNAEELAIAYERLGELEKRFEQIVADPHKSRRAKEMELAGVRGMMMQIEREIREHKWSLL